MTGMLTVAAIPTEGEQVWKLSSEKVPHLTIMVMSDTVPNRQRIQDFIEHAAQQLTRFGLSVDRRGKLGDKDADVLFFQKNRLAKELDDFRANLLKDTDIFIAYNKVEQFPEWIPHLTLGYPDSPAKEIDSEFPPSWVNFDRIAFWTDDYDGPEFELRDNMSKLLQSFDSGDVYSDDFLEHYGVLGMHWGKRKARAEAPRASNYGVGQQRYDQVHYGKRGSDRINEHLTKGLTIQEARKAETSYRRRRTALIVGGTYAALMLAKHGPTLMQGLANGYVGKKNMAAGAKAAANLFADNRGIGNHKVIDLGFDAATGVFR